ncbi:MAG: HPr family phosphocarrier protein [Acetobacteraceae bacterium]|nr:HPr family phosphocarrier protein [Acetobacteraceae bacterium]
MSEGGATLTRRVVVPNRRGLHARAAAKFVTVAERFGASVDVERAPDAANGARDGMDAGEPVSARSIMGLMMLGAGQGSHLLLRAEGWDAKEALDALAALVEAGFHEQD